MKLKELGFADLVAVRDCATKQIAVLLMQRPHDDEARQLKTKMLGHYQRIQRIAADEINLRMQNVT